MSEKPEGTRTEEKDEAYEAPRLERHGKLADVTRTRAGTGGDASKGKKGLGDPD